MDAKRPTGGTEFDALMGRLAQVPRKEVDRVERAWKKSRAKKKRKPKQ